MANEEYVKKRPHLFQPGNKAATNRGPNKVSEKVKNALVKFLEDNIESVQESFDTLKPLEKLQFVANILPYVVPKLSAVQTENETKLSGGINIRWSDPGIHNTGNQGSNGKLPSIQERLPDNLQSGGNQVGEDLHD